jgi:YebC/PmpR family DNA-binding regulatory protein
MEHFRVEMETLNGGITMSGHSKWHNIQRRKGKQDSVRGQLFTKLSKDIYLAAKEGGGNPDTNFRLKTALERARQSNLPADSITRTIAKATGTLEGHHYEELLYEGYGPAGTAVMMEVVTDNRNRTAADVRHIFAKRGGNLGESGCVAWMFRRIGEISIDKATTSLSFDDLMLLVLDAGADDIKETEDQYVVTTAPEQLAAVRDHLEESGLTLADAEITYEPQNTIPVEGETLDQVLDLVDALEAYDDVQSVYANFEPVEE